MPWLLLAGIGAAVWFFSSQKKTDQDEIKRAYLYALQNERDPGILREFAAKLREAGMPNEAMALEAKALGSGAVQTVLPTMVQPMIQPMNQPMIRQATRLRVSGTFQVADRMPTSYIPHDFAYRNGDWEMR